MRVSEIYLLLKEIYPEANDILGEINQNGVYLYLQKISPMAHQRDKAHFRLFCSAVTYDKSAVSLIEYLDELRERAIRAFGAFGEDIVANIEFENLYLEFNTSIFLSILIISYSKDFLSLLYSFKLSEMSFNSSIEIVIFLTFE